MLYDIFLQAQIITKVVSVVRVDFLQFHICLYTRTFEYELLNNKFMKNAHLTLTNRIFIPGPIRLFLNQYNSMTSATNRALKS